MIEIVGQQSEAWIDEFLAKVKEVLVTAGSTLWIRQETYRDAVSFPPFPEYGSPEANVATGCKITIQTGTPVGKAPLHSRPPDYASDR